MSKSFNAKMTVDERRAYYREAQRRYRAAHPELRQKARKYMQSWHQAHQVEQSEYRKRYWREVLMKAGEKRRQYMLKTLYRMTPEHFEAMLVAQCGRCAICGKDFGERVPHIDHDHQSNEVRGLLCHWCNAGIGALQESPVIFQNALDYLAA